MAFWNFLALSEATFLFGLSILFFLEGSDAAGVFAAVGALAVVASSSYFSAVASLRKRPSPVSNSPAIGGKRPLD